MGIPLSFDRTFFNPTNLALHIWTNTQLTLLDTLSHNTLNKALNGPPKIAIHVPESGILYTARFENAEIISAVFPGIIDTILPIPARKELNSHVVRLLLAAFWEVKMNGLGSCLSGFENTRWVGAFLGECFVDECFVEVVWEEVVVTPGLEKEVLELIFRAFGNKRFASLFRSYPPKPTTPHLNLLQFHKHGLSALNPSSPFYLPALETHALTWEALSTTHTQYISTALRTYCTLLSQIAIRLDTTHDHRHYYTLKLNFAVLNSRVEPRNGRELLESILNASPPPCSDIRLAALYNLSMMSPKHLRRLDGFVPVSAVTPWTDLGLLALPTDVFTPCCAGCGSAEFVRRFQKCGGCKGVKYCSRECQVGHWGVHKVECRRRLSSFYGLDD
ncbi:uncharacterized protein SPPG_04368 [Spizellomyces punctatus DAOM BR117]|uniref:MYND-type domain-containing protein n=1 Tax=Spizellomyces punctatus (strain DAOM BR117) TaxID=645134 RepID=A0A0L0HG63_SPIPD|nr:uncharacterized protein SPPG_04368 [Spizellomyces punctatus DAOM BR117]KND00022.1 hypothetical protein SPPG_04368 [Spizellomyces punctatus DAOM BR117]|eukprot:XP_016608061.1 hypothetical protein SPPG_04368 [Spizellomyces punctatus DAOM BR117]